MRFRNSISFFLILATYFLWAQKPHYRVNIDLNQVSNDKLPIILYPPATTDEFSEFQMAKIVPGTYEISDFGRFITDFKAFDSLGSPLEVKQLSTNRWQIENGGRLDKITYWCHDTFDKFPEYGKGVIFEPGGTSIESENQVFVLNPFGFIGYLKEYQFLPYEVTIDHSDEIYGATSLQRQLNTPLRDVFVADDFNFLADAPIMYAKPDTASQSIGDAKIMVSVYSPNQKISAKEVSDKLTDLLKAQEQFLGGKLPVDRYNFLIYLSDKRFMSGALGALEHSYSSMYTLPEESIESIGQIIRDVSAHEFFHIVTPLNIHSDEIGSFDYIDPKMSQHLWLYEGVTEYNSMLVQVKYGLYDQATFVNELANKMDLASLFPSGVSFTEMSRQILTPEYAPMYENVYYKGALIGMCLDLYLIKYSQGTQNLQWLMHELSKKYGKDRAFEDDELFDDIEGLTNPEVREFLDRYVAGNEELPLQEVLSWAGYALEGKEVSEQVSLGNIGLDVNEVGEVTIVDLSTANSFADDMGYLEGDVLLSLNGELLTLNNIEDVLDTYSTTTKPNDKVKVTVRREVNGKTKTKRLKAKALFVKTQGQYMIEKIPNISDEVLFIQKKWLKPD